MRPVRYGFETERSYTIIIIILYTARTVGDAVETRSPLPVLRNRRGDRVFGPKRDDGSFCVWHVTTRYAPAIDWCFVGYTMPRKSEEREIKKETNKKKELIPIGFVARRISAVPRTRTAS